MSTIASTAGGKEPDMVLELALDTPSIDSKLEFDPIEAVNNAPPLTPENMNPADLAREKLNTSQDSALDSAGKAAIGPTAKMSPAMMRMTHHLADIKHLIDNRATNPNYIDDMKSSLSKTKKEMDDVNKERHGILSKYPDAGNQANSLMKNIMNLIKFLLRLPADDAMLKQDVQALKEIQKELEQLQERAEFTKRGIERFAQQQQSPSPTPPGGAGPGR